MSKNNGKKRRRWTEREKNFLANNWGEKNLVDIAKYLGRDIAPIKRMVRALGLPPARDATELLTQREVARIMGCTNKKLAYWENKRKIIKFKKRCLTGKQIQKMISMDELIKVLKKHQDLWDANKMELYALGSEPQWLKDKRKRDAQVVYGNNNEPWTPYQDQQLYLMWRKKVSQNDMAKALSKTERAVRHRIEKHRKEWIANEQSSNACDKRRCSA